RRGPQARPGVAGHRDRPAHAGARRHDRERRPAQHAALAAPGRLPPELGDQLLRARLRRAAAGRRPGRRPVRPPEGVSGRGRRVHPGLGRAPMVPPAVVRDRNRGGAYAVMLLLGAGMLAMFYLLTLYMQVVRGYSAVHTGLAYLPFVAGVGVASGGLGPRLVGALPARVVIAAGMLLCAGGLAWYAAMLTP